MSKFPLAYCEAIGELLEPEDVIDIYLRDGDFPLLHCPDESCRNEIPDTEITPVCCNPYKPCAGLSPYFRTHAKHEHSENCQYHFLSEHTDHIVKHKKEYMQYAPDANLLKSLDGISDTSLLPDIYISEFKPVSEVETVKREAQKLIQIGKSKKDAYRIARCKVPQTTGRLSIIIDIAEALEKTKERDKVPLSIPGRRKATYESAFFSLYSLKHDYKTPYILYGGARIKKTTTGFVVVYASPLK